MLNDILTEYELLFQLKKRSAYLKLIASHMILNKNEEGFLLNNNPSYIPNILNKEILLKHFPNKTEANQIYPEIDKKANDLYNSNSKYYRHKDDLYCGTFDIEFADKLLKIFHDRNHVDIVNNGIFKNSIRDFNVNQYYVNLLKAQDYLDGVPLFIGETTNTCDALGKLGSDLAINAILSPNLQICTIRKKIDNDVFIHLGHLLLLKSQDCSKIIMSSMETIYIPIEICYKILIEICTQLKQSFNKTIQIGTGGRTLRSLGYYKDNFPTELLNRHFEIVRGISSQDDYDILMQYIKQNKHTLLNNFIFKIDNEQMDYSFGNCEIHEDARFHRLFLA